ncbi:MAG: FxSxx-COOH system tetratricopeptide repeat protein [Mycobacteriales bacterium]
MTDRPSDPTGTTASGDSAVAAGEVSGQAATSGGIAAREIQGSAQTVTVYVNPVDRPGAAVAASTDSPVFHLRGHRPDPHFVGREVLLDRIRDSALSGRSAALVQAVSGLGGLGKTRLAIEYAYRHRDEYRLVWWVRAEQQETLVSDYAELAGTLGLPSPDQQDLAVAAVRQELGRRTDWLLIFDNADDTEAVDRLLPDLPRGHVLITTRRQAWPSAETVRVDALSTDAAVDYLRCRTGVDDRPTATSLAEALGNLPLALSQAAAVIADGMTAGEYLDLLHTRAPELFAEGHPPDYRASVTTTWQVSFDRLSSAPAAVALIRLCAFLAADAVPLDVLQPSRDMPADVVGALTDPLARSRATGALRKYSLAEVANGQLSMHRLVQLVVRTQLGDDAGTWAATAVRAVASAFPTSPDDPSGWPTAEQLVPHALIAADHAKSHGVAQREAAGMLERAARYLVARGLLDQAADYARRACALASHFTADDTCALAAQHAHATVLHQQGKLGAARELLEDVYERRRRVLGARHITTLATGRELMWTRFDQGEWISAQALDEDLVQAHEQALGPEHPDTLTAMHNHAVLISSAGRPGAALQIEQQVLEARRRVLGEDHPDTLTAMANLANTLHEQGDLTTARAHDEHVLTRRTALLGQDHPDTLRAMANLAATLHEQGDLTTARAHHEHVLARATALLGEDHPNTLDALASLAATLHEQGDLTTARAHDEHVLARRTALLGEDHPDTLRAMANLAATLRDQGDLTTARAHDEHVLARRTALLGEDHPDTLSAMDNLAATVADQGDLAGARRLLVQAAARSRQVLGARHPQSTSLAWDLARNYAAAGNVQAARLVLERDLSWLRKAKQSTLSARQRLIKQDLSKIAARGSFPPKRR